MIEVIIWTLMFMGGLVGLFILIANNAQNQNKFNAQLEEAESLEKKKFLDGLNRAEKERLYDLDKMISEKRAKDAAYRSGAIAFGATSAWMKYMNDDKK